jgi:ribosomal protein S18 acetylase RimI-like enzyme
MTRRSGRQHPERPMGDATESRSLRVDRLPPDRVVEAGAVLARAFHGSPSFAHIFPNPERRARALPPFFSLAVADGLRHGDICGAVDGDRLVGVAVWLPPGRYPLGTRRKLAALPFLLRVLLAAPRSFPALARLGANVERAFPSGRHWYLEVVGVDERARGKGIGGQLLEPVLGAADRDGVACYLETDLERNVRWYERLGFQVYREQLELVSGGPRHWTMIHKPRRV